MKYSISFFPEKRKGVTLNVPINLSVTFENQRMIYYTGKRCDIEQWNRMQEKKKNQPQINGQTVREFFSDLDHIKVACDDILKFYEATNVKPTPVQLRNELKNKLGRSVQKPLKDGFFDRFEQYRLKPGIALSTAKNIKSVIAKIKYFNPDTTFASLDVQYLSEFHALLLSDYHISKNSASINLNWFRNFISFAIKRGLTTNNPFLNFTIDKERYGKPVYITIEERDKLYDAKLEDPLLIKTRDIFVFQCMIGCRISDLEALRKSNIINGNIEYIAIKTKDVEEPLVARVPLTKKALNIIARYNLPDGRLVPYIQRDLYNVYLKKLFKEVGITRLVTVPNKKTRKNKQVPICDIVSSHMSRRTFIGGLYKKGVRNEIIASMSGHVKNSRAFSRYYDIDVEDQRGAINMIE